MTRDEATREACQIVTLAYQTIGYFDEPSDGFCSSCPAARIDGWTYRNSGRALEYVRKAVLRALKEDGYMGGAMDKSRDAGHPEDRCEKCGGPNVTWFAPNHLWNEVARTQDCDPMLCPVCFIKAAEEKGVKPSSWRVAPRMGERASRGLLIGLASYLNDMPLTVEQRCSILEMARGFLAYHDAVLPFVKKESADAQAD